MRKPTGHIRPHGAGYEAAVPVGRDPITKRYSYAYRQARTLQEAEKVRDRMLAELEAGRGPRDKTTFGQLLDDVLEVAHLDLSTRVIYQGTSSGRSGPRSTRCCGMSTCPGGSHPRRRVRPVRHRPGTDQEVAVLRTRRSWYLMKQHADTQGGGWQRMWGEGVGDVIKRDPAARQRRARHRYPALPWPAPKATPERAPSVPCSAPPVRQPASATAPLPTKAATAAAHDAAVAGRPRSRERELAGAHPSWRSRL